MASSVEEIEEDYRSIRLQKTGEPLNEFLTFLMDDKKYFPIDRIHSLDNLFDSFFNETEFPIYYQALQMLFRKVNFYTLELANIKIALNVARIFDDFLTKFKTQTTEDNVRSILNSNILNVVSQPTEENLLKLEDTDYTIAVVYLKHFGDLTNLNLEALNCARLQNEEGVDVYVKKLIQNIYDYPSEDLIPLLYFQFRLFIIIRGTMIVTTEIIDLTMEHLKSPDYRDDWIKIYANKMLANLIVPIISFKQHGNQLDVKNKELLNWLLKFSEKSLGERVRDDKWESINENDFKNTWTFVKRNATRRQSFSFESYLRNNGFTFQLNDPIANESYNLTP